MKNYGGVSVVRKGQRDPNVVRAGQCQSTTQDAHHWLARHWDCNVPFAIRLVDFELRVAREWTNGVCRSLRKIHGTLRPTCGSLSASAHLRIIQRHPLPLLDVQRDHLDVIVTVQRLGRSRRRLWQLRRHAN